jgi:ubiquinone/menaquinone biosynthesis C-methylase UbiE
MPKWIFDFLSPIYDIIIRAAPPSMLFDFMNLSGNCNEKILEIGAGTGRIVTKLSKLCESLWLLDPSIQMLARAKKKIPEAKIVYGYAEKMPFPDNYFDRVFAVDSLHHWDDQLEGLKEIKRILLNQVGQFIVIDFDPQTQFGHFIKSMEKFLRMGSKFFTPREMRFLDQGTYVTLSKK